MAAPAMFGTVEIKSEVLSMDVQMYDEMETDGELLPAGAVPWMVGTAPDWPPNIVSGWLDAAMASRGPLPPASHPPLPPLRTTATAALPPPHHHHDYHHHHNHQQQQQQLLHKAFDAPRPAHPGDHSTRPTVPGTAGTAGEGSGTTGGGSGASAHDELWSLYMGYSHGPGSGQHDGPGSSHAAVHPGAGEPHGVTAAGHAAWAVASLGGAEQASGNGGGAAAATADGWAAPGDRSDAGGGGNPVAAAAAAEAMQCEGHAHDDDAMAAAAADAAAAGAVLDDEQAALMRAQLLHHPRTPELVHAVTTCRKVGVRSRNVADALDAARDTAVGHLAQLRREAGRLGRIAPPTDPQLDEFMDRCISLCNSYQMDLVAMFEDAEVIIRDFENKLCSALQGGGGGADARAHISAAGGRQGSQGAAAPSSGGGGGGGSCSSLGSGQPDTPGGKLELTNVLKRKYQAEILQLQEAFSRPKKTAKLPEESTTTLKTWWKANFVWPYPSDDDKRLLCVAAELSATQINNWFINQRKRHWHKLFKGRQQPQSREESEQLMREMGLID